MFQKNENKKGNLVTLTGADLEIIANFTSEMLFNEKGNTLERFINEVNSEDRNAISRFIHDFISWLKARLKGEKVSLKIVMLENRFAAVLRNVDNTNAQKNNTTNDGDVQYLFAGQKSRTSNYSLLDQAIKLEDVGKATPDEIRQQTGWFRGYDGKWRYEISDRDMEVDPTGKFHTNPDIRRQTELFNKVYFDGTATTEEIEELQILNQNLKGVSAKPEKLGQLIKHDKLFEAYPFLKDVNIRFEYITERGAYNPVFNEIVLSNNIKLNKEQLTKTLIHEIQHAIQYYEAFAGGSNTEYWRDLGIDENELFKYYENTAGEVEARDAANRWWRTDEARKEMRPDIDRADVVFADGNVNSFLSKGNVSDSKKLIETILKNIDIIPKNNLYSISGDGIINGVKSKYILDIFDVQGNVAYREDLGTIELTETGAESTIFHGFGKNKLIAAEGIKNVIEKGVIISKIENYNNKGYNRYVIAGYGTINNLDSIMAVAINEYVTENGRKSFYLHEIMIKNKDASPFMAEQQGAVSAGKASFDNTIPQEVQSVNTHYTQESDNNSSPEQDNDGNSYSFGDIDVYDEAQYNDFGWVRYNDVLSASEYNTLLSRYADYKHNKHNYPTTRFGEAVIHSSELPDVIMYVKGPIVSPQIIKAVRIETDSYTASSIKGWILQNEYRQVSQPYSAIESLYGQEVLSICRKRDYESFWEYQARTKRNSSPTSDTAGETEQDGTRSTQQNKTTDRAGLDDSAFSMPENDGMEYSFEDDVVDKTSSLAERVRLGEISQTEYLNELRQLMDEATEKYGAIPKLNRDLKKYTHYYITIYYITIIDLLAVR